MEDRFGSATADPHEELRRAQERMSRLAQRNDETRHYARRMRRERDALGLVLATLFVVICALLLTG